MGMKGKGGGSIIGLAALALHVTKAVQHKREGCVKCRDRDLVTIALDVIHLWGPEGDGA